MVRFLKIHKATCIKGRIKRLPDIVTIEAIDEDIAAKIQEVDGGCSHRHL